MKFFGVVIVFLCLIATSCEGAGKLIDVDKSASTNKAIRLVTMLACEDFVAVTDQFDSNMKCELPAGKLKLAWTSLIAQAGVFKKQVSTRTEEMPSHDVVLVTCEFEKLTADVKIVFDSNQHVSGLFIVPHQEKADDSVPLYAKPILFCEKKVTVGSGEWTLPGTLTIPKGKGPFPVVVLVQGSGPQDRDETVGANKPFRDIALGLSTRGIAVLRYDKRTRVYPSRMASMQNITVNDETVDDALSAVCLLRATDCIDKNRIFVLGHSLGGMLLPRIGQADPRIAGFVMLAGTARPLEDVLLEQIEYISSIGGDITDEQKARIIAIKGQVDRVKDPQLLPTSPGMILGAPPSYWLDLRKYDAPKVAKCLKQPMLVLQGERDYQVTTRDFDLWKKFLSARANVQFRLYMNLNHLFIAGQGKSTPSEYELAGHVDELVIRDIACWIKAH